MMRATKTYSDEYIEHYGKVYQAFDIKYNLHRRGIRFETFLDNPEYWMALMQNIHGVADISDHHELAIDKLPGAGVRHNGFFQIMKHHCYELSRKREGRLEA